MQLNTLSDVLDVYKHPQFRKRIFMVFHDPRLRPPVLDEMIAGY